MDRAYQLEFNEFQDVEFSQHNRPMHQQMNFQNRQLPTQNQYARYDVDEVNGYYDQFGCEEYNDFVPPQQQFIQRGQNRINLGQQRFNNAQQNSYGRSSGSAEGSNNEMMELLKQIKQGFCNYSSYQGDQDNYESNRQTQENEQAGQHESDDNSINEKFDTIMELLKDIQKSNEVRDRQVKALSQQVGQLAEEVAIIRRNQDQLLGDFQENTSHNSSHTSVHIDEVSTPFSEISIVETHSPQGVEGVVDEINGSECKNGHDQEIKSFTKSINGSNGKFSEIGNFNVKVPFPEALVANENLSKRAPPKGERWESFEKIKINKPFLKRIKESPDHVECLEELSNHKRRHKFPKHLNLTASVNAVLMGISPLKTQDPGTPVISIQIGDVKLDMALLDLGSCVSILPGSLYDQYDFGPLQKVKSTVVLADQTPIGLRGIIKNVIVKVGEFFYPVDFLVLDCAKNTQPTVILGRPFLATTKAIINCAEGTVRMRFGDTKMSLKLFSSSPNHKTDRCGSPEKENQTEKKECFMTDRVHEDKTKKKSKKRKRKNAKEVLEFNCYREACKWYDQVWEETGGGNRTNSGAEGRKHPTRPP
ncbi:uncharacterized protein LOC110919343 [Helianthus annuus]|uniref:uncharacterized protein LOC110919343 n=1 Tax=Helianthus annuus TaxID=4232 RepID=UPI000B9000D2|nr:uncharacterized protein LOC110919343 [Helianthus annuus]